MPSTLRPLLLLVVLGHVPTFAGEAPVIAFPRKNDLQGDTYLASSADGKLLIVISKRDPTIIYGCNTDTGAVRYQVQVPKSYLGIADFAWPPAGDRMWLLTNNWSEERWLVEFNTRTGEFSPQLREFPRFGDNLEEGLPTWIRTSADGECYVLGLRKWKDNPDDVVKVYDATTHAVISRFVPHQPHDEGRGHGLFDLDLSANGRFVVTVGSDRKVSAVIKVWDAQDGKLLSVRNQHRFEHVKVRFTSDARHVVTAGALTDPNHKSEFRLRQWSVDESGQVAETPVLDFAPIPGASPGQWDQYGSWLSLSHDGSTAIVACTYFLRVCNLESGRISGALGRGLSQNGKPLGDFPDFGATLSSDGKSLWLGNKLAEIYRFGLPDVSGKRKLRK